MNDDKAGRPVSPSPAGPTMVSQAPPAREASREAADAALESSNSVTNDPALNAIEARRLAMLNSTQRDITGDKAPPRTDAARDPPLDQENEQKQAMRRRKLPADQPATLDTDKQEKEKEQRKAIEPEILPPEYRGKLLRSKDAFVLRDDPSYQVFKARDDTLSTRLNDPGVARMMAASADQQGWNRIKVTGTETFRREVWLEATARGIQARGYSPSEVDYQEASLRASRFEGRNAIAADKKALRNLEPDAILQRNPRHRNAATAIAVASTHISNAIANPSDQRVMDAGVRERIAQDNGANLREIRVKPIEGEIVRMGYAKYKFDKSQNDSFYIRLSENGRERDIWGVGLADAATLTKAKPGDRVAIRSTGHTMVTVHTKIHDRDGKVIGTEPKEAQRKSYEITVAPPEQAQRFDPPPPQLNRTRGR